MEPLDDRELDRILQQWQAPGAPPSLSGKVLPPSQWWQWLTKGTIRVPVPVGIAALLAVAAFLYLFRTHSSTAEQPTAIQPAKSVSLADFQPVKQLEPRVIGRANDRN